MECLFVLQHLYFDKNQYQHEKIIGNYSSFENAHKSYLQASQLPGFSEFPGTFSIYKVKVNGTEGPENFTPVWSIKT